MFAMTGDAAEPGDLDSLPVDESQMECAMESLAGEAGNLSEDDPRQAAQMMRKLSNITGLKFGGGIEEALARMEAGEDPESIEADMGDRLESEDPFITSDGVSEKKTASDPKTESKPPKRDDTLYEL
jgi:hypothetical protein